MDPHKLDCEEVHKDEENVCPLRRLVTLLTEFFSQRMSTILEILLLYKFSVTQVFPIIAFNPKLIINSMMTQHEKCMSMIHKDRNYLKILVYKYNSGDKVEVYVFSNNMTISADVITICFLNYIMKNPYYKQCQPMHDLMVLMKSKYIIQTDTEANLDPQMLTLNRITFSYPSVSFDIARYDKNNHVFLSLSKTFFNLPHVFCSPWSASLIPVLNSDYKTPLALLLAIAVMFNENKSCYLLYQRIVALYTSEVFPTCFKLELCKRWGIVYMIGNEYNFAPYFTTARGIAIQVISSLMTNDPSLQYVLSKI